MLTQEKLHQLLDYDQETGIFRWKVTRKSQAGKARAGSIAGSIDLSHGYRKIGIDGTPYYSHRLAWLYVYGSWPSQVDHMNGIRDDNRLSNLRECSPWQNLANRKTVRAGLKGCKFDKRTSRWSARIRKDGKETYLGSFNAEKDAHKAYLAAAMLLFGDFARAA
jgi:hypothetical protein